MSLTLIVTQNTVCASLTHPPIINQYLNDPWSWHSAKIACNLLPTGFREVGPKSL